MTVKKTNCCSLWLLILLLVSSSSAFALYPRAYIAAPADSFLLLGYYEHVDTSGRYANGSQLNIDMNASRRIGLIRPAYYLDWLDNRFALNAILPVGTATLEGTSVTSSKQSSSGFGDPVLNAGIFLINDRVSRTWLGLSEYITLPYGEYDNSQSINLGENRFKARTELGLAKGFGEYHIDVTANMTAFGANTEFNINNRLEQDLLWGFEIHLTRNLSATSFIGIGALFQWGGESQLNGVSRNDEQQKQTLQISYSFKPAKKQNLAMYYKHDIEVENGFRVRHFSLRYSYMF